MEYRPTVLIQTILSLFVLIVVVVIIFKLRLSENSYYCKETYSKPDDDKLQVKLSDDERLIVKFKGHFEIIKENIFFRLKLISVEYEEFSYGIDNIKLNFNCATLKIGKVGGYATFDINYPSGSITCLTKFVNLDTYLLMRCTQNDNQFLGFIHKDKFEIDFKSKKIFQ